MDKISSWCKFIALFSIFSSAVFLILPEGKSKKAFKTVLSFIMIYSFVLLLSDVETDFSRLSDYFNFREKSDVSESLEGYEYYPLISAAESETEEYFNDLLSATGVQGYCEAVCDVESEKIFLREIRVNGKLAENQKMMLTEEVKKIYGEETSIIFSGEQ